VSYYSPFIVSCLTQELYTNVVGRQIDLFDISDATDIHGTKYDDPENPVAPSGELEDDIKPAEYVDFIDMIDDDELERFGLHNGKHLDFSVSTSIHNFC
jgi:hypothetical protein